MHQGLRPERAQGTALVGTLPLLRHPSLSLPTRLWLLSAGVLHTLFILSFSPQVHIISKQSQPDFVFEVFERLNMGATQLNEQELRNCIYQGAYTDLLGRLAANEHLLKVYKSTQPHLRMRDRELILRFFAMLRSGPEGARRKEFVVAYAARV